MWVMIPIVFGQKLNENDTMTNSSFDDKLPSLYIVNLCETQSILFELILFIAEKHKLRTQINILPRDFSSMVFLRLSNIRHRVAFNQKYCNRRVYKQDRITVLP